MAANFWTPRRRRTGLIVAVPLAVILIALLTINAILEPIIARKIRNAVVKSSDSLYQVRFSSLYINIFTGTAELDDIKLVADTVRARSADQVVTAGAKELRITGASLLAYWLHKKLEIGHITLTGPQLSYTLNKPAKEKPANTKTLYQKISPALKLIAVNDISLEHAGLNFADYRGPKANVQHLKELNLRATGLLIDSATQKDTSRTLFCKDIVTMIQGFKGFTDDGLYRYSLRSAHFSTRSKRLVARGIVLKAYAG